MEWIFQAIPKRYDLRERMKEGATETWLVTRYRKEMRRGDLVFFWMAGNLNIRGLYGWGRIIGKSPRYIDDWGFGIEVLYKKVFPTHLPSKTINAHPSLADHTLFKMAIGTNFKLEANQTIELINLIRNSFGQEVTPNG